MKKFIPPKNFSYHNPLIVRSGYPDVECMRFIKSLGFRKFINLCELWPQKHEALMAKELQVSLTHYPLAVGEYSFAPIDAEKIESIIKVVLQETMKGSKIWLYDEDGTKKVAVICAILRKHENWDDVSVFNEYYSIAGNASSEFAARFINNFKIT
jgi:hypothetical protein